MKSPFIDTLPPEIKVSVKADNGHVGYVTVRDVFGKWLIDYDELKDFAHKASCNIDDVYIIY